MTKLGVLAQLHQKLGERKIDIAVYPDTSRPFPRMVMHEGIYMTRVKIELLQEELAGLQLAAGHLQYAMERCRNLVGHEEALPPYLK